MKHERNEAVYVSKAKLYQTNKKAAKLKQNDEQNTQKKLSSIYQLKLKVKVKLKENMDKTTKRKQKTTRIKLIR